ncbi:glycosyltransferase family 2 protein [Thermodesulfobacteriota bacterium]
MMCASSLKVSVITPSYNRADFLPRSIASVLRQDFKDLELLIIDDGSTDNTADVVKKIQAQDRRLRYFKLPQNRGIGFARDFGLRNALGEYIAWVDSDDLWLPDKLKMQIEVMDHNPDIDILFSDFWNINHIEGKKKRSFKQYQTAMGFMETRNISKDRYIIDGGIDRAILVDSFVHFQTTLFRSKIIERVGSIDRTLNGSEDFEFFWRASVLGAQFSYMNRLLVERHIIDSSVTRKNNCHSLYQMLIALQKCRQTSEKCRRYDLLKHICAAEQRMWRNIIRKYSITNQRAKIWQTFKDSLKNGLSVRTFVFFLLGMSGSNAMSFAMKLRTKTLCDPDLE